MNSSLLLPLESALVAHLGDGRLPFAQSVVGASSPAHSDEVRYGILGQYVRVPSVVVTVEDGEYDFPDNPCASFPVKVAVTSSQFQSSVATHIANATTVSDELWDKDALFDGVNESSRLVIAGVQRIGEGFRKEDSAMVTEFSLKIVVSSKD